MHDDDPDACDSCQGPSDFDFPHAKPIIFGGMAAVVGTVLWFAFTAEPVRRGEDSSPRTTLQQGVGEQQIVMNDGRSMLCLFFPPPSSAVSCDWEHARAVA